MAARMMNSAFVLLAIAAVLRTATAQSGLAKATYYADTSAGSCGYGSPNGYIGIAVPDGFPGCSGPQGCCGTCFEINCDNSVALWGKTNYCKSNKSIIVKVDNSCPTCGSTHMDLPASVFPLLASGTTGQINTAFTKVPCPVTGNMEVLWAKQEAWYQAFGVKNVAGSGQVSQFEIKGSNEQAYTRVPNDPAWPQARFILDGIPKKQCPCKVKITGAGPGEVTTGTISYSGGSIPNFGVSTVTTTPAVTTTPVVKTTPVVTTAPVVTTSSTGSSCTCPTDVVPEGKTYNPAGTYTCAMFKAANQCGDTKIMAAGKNGCPSESCCAKTCGRLCNCATDVVPKGALYNPAGTYTCAMFKAAGQCGDMNIMAAGKNGCPSELCCAKTCGRISRRRLT